MYMLQCLLLISFLVGSIAFFDITKNACKDYKDYNFKLFNDDCFYNPDADSTVSEIIVAHGYPLQTYRVETEDGYTMDLYRIPNGLESNDNTHSKQPIFLQHGILSSSSPYVLVGNLSLGFLLAEKGYDVWLGNSRGSTYGKGHKTLSLRDQRYWNFTYHEQGIYDLPAAMDMVWKLTGRNDIIYIGQSMGTMLPYVYAASLPEHAASRVKLIVSLAPTVFLGDITSLLKYVAPYVNILKKIGQLLKMDKFLIYRRVYKLFLNNFCLSSQVQLLVCREVFFIMFGRSYNQSRADIWAVLFGHWPAGSSFKTALHLMQGINTNRFSQFDYGKDINMQYYNSPYPPEYNLTKVNIPSYIMVGTSDALSSVEGAIRLYNALPNNAALYKLDGFNHADFFFAKDVYQLEFAELFRVLDSFKK